VFQEESAIVREKIPYVKLHRHNQKYRSGTVDEILTQGERGCLAVPLTVSV